MVFFIFIISHKQKTLSHTPSLSHARTDTYSLSLSLYRIHIHITQRHPSHRQNLELLSLSLGSRHTLNLSPHTCKTGFLSLHHTHSHSLSLSLTLCTPYVYIYVSRMDFNHTQSLFTYEYDTNIGV